MPRTWENTTVMTFKVLCATTRCVATFEEKKQTISMVLKAFKSATFHKFIHT